MGVICKIGYNNHYIIITLCFQVFFSTLSLSIIASSYGLKIYFNSDVWILVAKGLFFHVVSNVGFIRHYIIIPKFIFRSFVLMVIMSNIGNCFGFTIRHFRVRVFVLVMQRQCLFGFTMCTQLMIIFVILIANSLHYTFHLVSCFIILTSVLSFIIHHYGAMWRICNSVDNCKMDHNIETLMLLLFFISSWVIVDRTLINNYAIIKLINTMIEKNI